MAGNPRVLGLVEVMLDSGMTPEEVCRDCPDLLPEVKERWKQVCKNDEVRRLILRGRPTPSADGMPAGSIPASART